MTATKKPTRTLVDHIAEWAETRTKIGVIYDTSGSMVQLQSRIWGLHRDLGPVLAEKKTGTINLGNDLCFQKGFDPEIPPVMKVGGGGYAHKALLLAQEELGFDGNHGYIFVTDGMLPGMDQITQDVGNNTLWIMFGVHWPLELAWLPRLGTLLAVGG